MIMMMYQTPDVYAVGGAEGCWPAGRIYMPSEA
jgi:hypothetical protein